MTLSRRSFSFASLAALLGGRAAQAAEPSAQQQAPIPELADPVAPPAAPKVTATLKREGDEVVLTLTVRHEGGGEELAVMVAQGSRPPGNPVVLLTDAEAGLARVYGEVDRRELMSRMGPLPRWANVVAGGSVEIGPYRFALPKGARPPATVRGQVETMGGVVPFEVKGVTWVAGQAT